MQEDTIFITTAWVGGPSRTAAQLTSKIALSLMPLQSMQYPSYIRMGITSSDSASRVSSRDRPSVLQIGTASSTPDKATKKKCFIATAAHFSATIGLTRVPTP